VGYLLPAALVLAVSKLILQRGDSMEAGTGSSNPGAIARKAGIRGK